MRFSKVLPRRINSGRRSEDNNVKAPERSRCLSSKLRRSQGNTNSSVQHRLEIGNLELYLARSREVSTASLVAPARTEGNKQHGMLGSRRVDGPTAAADGECAGSERIKTRVKLRCGKRLRFVTRNLSNPRNPRFLRGQKPAD